MSKVRHSNNRLRTCFKGEMPSTTPTWLDQAEKRQRPGEKYNNSYTRLCKMIKDIDEN